MDKRRRVSWRVDLRVLGEAGAKAFKRSSAAAVEEGSFCAGAAVGGRGAVLVALSSSWRGAVLLMVTLVLDCCFIFWKALWKAMTARGLGVSPSCWTVRLRQGRSRPRMLVLELLVLSAGKEAWRRSVQFRCSFLVNNRMFRRGCGAEGALPQRSGLTRIEITGVARVVIVEEAWRLCY